MISQPAKAPNFVCEDSRTQRRVAIRVLAKEENIYCYLHENTHLESRDARLMRNMVQNGLREVFPNTRNARKKLFIPKVPETLLAPEGSPQPNADIATAMSSFATEGETIDHLMRTYQLECHQPDIYLIPFGFLPSGLKEACKPPTALTNEQSDHVVTDCITQTSTSSQKRKTAKDEAACDDTKRSHSEHGQSTPCQTSMRLKIPSDYKEHLNYFLFHVVSLIDNHIATWDDTDHGVFKIHDMRKLLELWSEKSGSPKNKQDFIRDIRACYLSGQITPVWGHDHTYRFNMKHKGIIALRDKLTEKV